MLKVDGKSSRPIWAWALYDFANSSFTTLVITFLYATFFTQTIAPDEITGTTQWSRAITITALIVAFGSPLLGALADRGGYRKPFLGVATVISIVATAMLYRVLPGQVAAALVLLVIANVAYELAGVFYNAFLPDISPRGRIGFVSGLGWGLGYFGGLLALGAALVLFVSPDNPWLGFGTADGENIRATNLLVAVWFAVFAIPLFVYVHEDKSRVSAPGRVVRDTVRQLRDTLAEVRKYRQIVRFLIARLIYNDGLVTIFAFGGIYAAGTFGLDIEDVLLFGIVINLAAGSGALAMGWLDDLIGAKRTIVISLVGLIASATIAVFARNVVWLWVAGILIGIFVGPNQSASRSMMGRFVPHERENEFFGFFAFSGKLTAFLGPFLLGELTRISGSQRVGVSVVIGLFVLGLVALMLVDEKEGAACRPSDARSGLSH